MEFQKVKLVVFVPLDSADVIRKVLGEMGAGVIGDYTYCSFTTLGLGRYIPGDSSNPHIGNKNNLEKVEEERIEVVCSREKAKSIIEAIKKAHPYEEVAIDVYPIISEDQL